MKKLLVGLVFSLASTFAFAQAEAGGAASGAGAAAGAGVAAVNTAIIAFGVLAVVGVAASGDNTTTTVHHQ